MIEKRKSLAEADPLSGVAPEVSCGTGQWLQAEPQRSSGESQVHAPGDWEFGGTQQALEPSRNRYAELYEAAPIGYLSLDALGVIQELNETGATLLGGDQERFLGTLFVRRIAKEDQFKFRFHLRECRQYGTARVELSLITQAGDRLAVRLDSKKTDAWIEEGIHYLMVVIDMTERKQIEEVLRESDRRRTEFLAMLGHELRNPLAPIRNAVKGMNKLDPADPKQQWLRDMVDRQVEHLTRLVDDLLDVSRIIRGKITLREAPVDVITVIDQALETSRPFIEAHHHALEVSVPDEPLPVAGDLVRLTQVIFNLLHNAAKYTPDGGQIWLSAAREHGEAVIRVRDTGEGIAPALLSQIFELFTQAERALDRSQGGLGIGLTIVKELVELHGGWIQAKSEGPGKGSEFTIWLPTLA